ncbi:hypothetical protein PC118_g11875 [Phytophthora cactorum]|uniref:Uncharacterized protein n=1 Tax=Phytophthora cactorum TaxID=29920 RepID=A0A8T1C6B0_9STRA|nr:hypothetical protein PC112_g5727 [Phytophthora cactorum]KAG2839322.1 hypothetical protein PC111_g3890 [Phytophthora cactorum]KAG2863444.1 hypothetical protein PC113_g5425 [Phytophthora cactorum]KAG2915838.1 hypothetical protein PC115_g11260 [Phytophthora cactorum]KAG2979223.1 hypothetical protein PC118_g11875 [Phytophthora cactorum]
MLLLSILLIAVTSTSYTRPVLATSSLAAKPNGTRLNATDYWVQDEPYKFQPRWTRLSDGKVVASNDSNFSNFAEYRGAIEAKTPWISKWVLSTEGRRTLKKDIPRLLMYNLVSPMDYGKSVRSGNVRRRRNKAIGMFLTDNLALPLVKSLGRVAWNLIQSHYVGYFEDEMFAQHLKMMNASEMIKEFNLTLPIDAIENAQEESRPNATLSYVYDGESKRSVLYARYTAAFVPYKGYPDRYYTRDDNLPLPTFPADSYPWLWSPRINETRTIASQLLESLSSGDRELDVINSGESKLGSCSPRCVEPESVRKLAHQAPNDSILANQSIPRDKTAMNAHDIKALDQIQVQLQEFYFDSGIPRFTTRSNSSRSAFPLLTEFLQETPINDTDTNNSESSGTGSFANSNEAGMLSAFSMHNTSDDVDKVTDFSTRSGVYAALTHFYSYPSVDKWMVEKFSKVNASEANCSVDRPCLVQSGVTVYTPSLTTTSLFQTFADMNVDPSIKRAVRLKALQDMTEIAFEAERRVLNHGLQGPSTVWYSNHDLDVDEFADAVLGTVNMSISGDSSPLHVFEKHMNERVPILDEVVSYYADTNHDTKISMELNRSIPMLDKFEESELVQLTNSVESQMKILDRSIVSYVQTRATNPLYQEVVNATKRGDFYNGSEYTLVGFGFVVPATNDKNVLYRDMKLPVPFHLVLRLIVRFQESRLLLPQESRQLLVCLAMAFYNLSFYRCRPALTQ